MRQEGQKSGFFSVGLVSGPFLPRAKNFQKLLRLERLLIL